MKAKYLIIYIVVGLAFVGVSLWVFLSNGRSAKAIRYKYRLGGIMLTAWSMLTFASCEGPGPFVTCYDPAPTEYSYIQGTETVKNGEELVVTVVTDRPGKYSIRISPYPATENAKDIQVQDFECESGQTECKMTIAAGDYKGQALATVYYLWQADDGNVMEDQIGASLFTII